MSMKSLQPFFKQPYHLTFEIRGFCKNVIGVSYGHVFLLTQRSRFGGPSTYLEHLCVSLGRAVEKSWSTFFHWYHFSHGRVQIGRQLVRFITLIGLNKFLMNMISLKTLQKISRTTFDGGPSENVHFWCFKEFYKQFYLL